MNKNKFNFKRYYAMLNAEKKRLLKINPKLNDYAGIYILTRYEGEKKFAYVGQSVKVLTRLADHIVRREKQQHIDRSLATHKLFSEDNPTGWRIDFFNCARAELDEKEREIISLYEGAGYELRNKTGGGQDEGKVVFEMKPRKGYRKGLEIGYSRAVNEIVSLLNKVDYTILPKLTVKGVPNLNSQKAVEKLFKIIEGGSNNET